MAKKLKRDIPIWIFNQTFRLERFEQAATAMEELLMSHPESGSEEATGDAQTCIIQVLFSLKFRFFLSRQLFFDDIFLLVSDHPGQLPIRSLTRVGRYSTEYGNAIWQTVGDFHFSYCY